MENFSKKKYISFCLIGLGNIGFRHLESILRINNINKIDIIDIEYNFEIVSKINKLNKKKIEIFYLYDYKKLDKKYDFLIISTNSDARFRSLKRFYYFSYSKNLILEKFLFDKEKHFIDSKKIIKKNKIQAWINCPRRTYKVYKKIYQKFDKKYNLSIECSGNKWNMASNSIHYIDLFSFFIKSDNFKYNLSGLHKKLYNSNKKNFKEFKGEIVVSQISNPNNFIILKDNNNYETFNMTIKYDNKTILIEETKENINIISTDIKQLNKTYYLEKQSDLTYKYIKEIQKNGKCELPKFLVYEKLHKDLFKNFQTFYKLNFSNKSLMIT